MMIMEILVVCLLGYMTFAFSQEPTSPHRRLDMECGECHTTGGWIDIKFDHEKTGYELYFRHNSVRCRYCHDLTDFAQINEHCISCHLDIHQSELGDECIRCHTEKGWQVFNPLQIHRNSDNPVIGKHILFDCEMCHYGQQIAEYRTLKSDCIECHRQEFERTQNPVHSSLGFGVRCDKCHAMVSWNPSYWREHDRYFPIYNGEHAETWSDCYACHIVAGDYTQFSCTVCHEHNRQKMDDKHDDVPGYIYDSMFCYQCHPRGKGDD